MRKEEVLKFLSERRHYFSNNFGITKLGLAGSLARGEENPHDIDVILEFEPDTVDLFEKKLQIKELIEQHFRLPVDILREKFIKPSVKALILSDAQFV